MPRARQRTPFMLANLRPGSIVVLPDGLDGNGNADRSVLDEALARILDGLAALHLRPVRLDALLGTPLLPRPLLSARKGPSGPVHGHVMSG